MNRALLIVDVQKCFTKNAPDAFIKRIESIQDKYSSVFISRYYNHDDSPFIKHLNWQVCMKDSEEFQLAFTPDKEAIVFDKTTYSSLHEDMKIYDEIHICGLETDACILKTALDLFENNIRPVILSDLCFSNGGVSLHRMALDVLKRNIGEEQVC